MPQIAALLLSLLCIVACLVITWELRPVKFYRVMKASYEQEIQVFNKLSGQINATSALQAHKNAQDELYVLVIGESLCADNMGVYDGFSGTTPFLSSIGKEGPAGVVFTQAYAPFVNTLSAVTTALSEGNLEEGLTFPKGENILSVARSAGFKSYWLSNQVRTSRFDTPIAAMADKADVTFFSIEASEGSSKQQRPDLYLLPQIDKALTDIRATPGNHLLIIHLMGSHSPYSNRYPDDYPEYHQEDPAVIGQLAGSMELREEYNTYMTSVRYNDDVLKVIYDRAAAVPGFAGLVYMSDHAESDAVQGGRHNLSDFDYAMSHIPLLAISSPLYEERYPDSLHHMQRHSQAVFSNDKLFDLLLDFMQVQSPAVTVRNSPASAEFAGLQGEQLIALSPEEAIATGKLHLDAGLNIAFDPRARLQGLLQQTDGLCGVTACGTVAKSQWLSHKGVTLQQLALSSDLTVQNSSTLEDIQPLSQWLSQAGSGVRTLYAVPAVLQQSRWNKQTSAQVPAGWYARARQLTEQNSKASHVLRKVMQHLTEQAQLPALDTVNAAQDSAVQAKVQACYDNLAELLQNRGSENTLQVLVPAVPGVTVPEPLQAVTEQARDAEIVALLPATAVSADDMAPADDRTQQPVGFLINYPTQYAEAD